MKFSLVALLALVAAAFFGVGCLLVPEQTMNIYGITGWNSGTLLVAKLLGVLFLFLAASLAAVRTCTDSELQHRFAKYLAAANLLAAVVVAYAAVLGIGNGLLWSSVAIFTFFVVAWTNIALRM
jgi:hypothetical protein